MESILVIAPPTVPLEVLLVALPLDCEFTSIREGWFVLQSAGRRAYFGADSLVWGELEPHEIGSILRRIPDPHFYCLDYSDLAFCRELLKDMVNRSDVLVDNNHGILCSGTDFVGMLLDRPDWDWRLD